MIRKLLFSIFLCFSATAFGQIEKLPVKVINGVSYYYYDVPPKATIYSITRTYGISREDLFKYNPQVIDGLRAGDTLIFPVTPEDKKEPADTSETIDISEVSESSDTAEVSVTAEVPVTSELYDTTELSDTTSDFEGLNIGVMLPFMLDSEAVTRNTQNHTAFYRGMLLAVEDFSVKDSNLTIRVFDTEGSNETLGNILSKPEVQLLDYIIAPGDSLAIELIAAAADTTGATVVNLFAVKNDAHLHHESVLQGNIPHDAMYSKAMEAFCKQLNDKKVLILNANDIPADKRSFTEEFADMLLKTGIPYEQIDYSGKLTAEDLHSLAPRNYVCIPTSATREALLKILPAMMEFDESNPMTEVELLGYPEWVVFRGEIKDKLHKLNATVYSRFSTDLDGADVATVNGHHTKWYGEVPQQSLPDIMLLGYDTMAWLINGAEKPYIGLQNSFKIADIDNAGQVNTGLYLINFNRNGRIDARSL